MFSTRSVIAEILSTFIFTSRPFLRCQSPLLATHFQPSHAPFAAPILAKSESRPYLLNATDPRSRIHLKTIPWEVVYAPLRVLLPLLQENIHQDPDARRL